jgi:hypothetical protein
MDRYEIPRDQAQRLVGMREQWSAAETEVVRLKAALFDAQTVSEQRRNEFKIATVIVAELLQIDPASRHQLTQDCTAFVKRGPEE